MVQPATDSALALMLLSLKQDIAGIKERLDKKEAYLPMEEAIEQFKAYLAENSEPNTQRSFDYLLRELGAAFPGQNVPAIPPVRLQEFLKVKWGHRKRSVLKQALAKLKWFYTWCSKYAQAQGMPPFLNPCDLIEVKEEAPPERPGYVPPEKMKALLASMRSERHWLMTAILLTAGLRISELIGDPRAGKVGLLKRDVFGRVLTLMNPKSGRPKEIAVIPGWVSGRLEIYIKGLGPADKVFPVSYSTVHDVITTHGRWAGLEIHPHDLRKWCATLWSRLHEHSMASFVLRHSKTKAGDITLVTNLEARYIAPLSVEEVMGKQDKYMEDIL